MHEQTRAFSSVMSDEELLKAFRKWRDRVGKAKAISELTGRTVNARTAELLSTEDDYKKSPRRKLRRAIEDILRSAS